MHFAEHTSDTFSFNFIFHLIQLWTQVQVDDVYRRALLRDRDVEQVATRVSIEGTIPAFSCWD